MTSPSFERIDYQLRYNKHIERRLIFDLLGRAHAKIGLGEHRYLGFGSMWFSDFRLAHRLLGLACMTSIERTEYAPRASYNKPYQSIKVLSGESGDILASFTKEEWDIPVVAWLDYDGSLSERVVTDVGVILSCAAPRSLICVTVNATRANYRPKPLASRPAIRKRSDTGLGQVEEMLGVGTVDSRFEGGVTAGGVHTDVSESQFAEFLAEALLAHMAHKIVASGRTSANAVPLRFVSLVNFCHKDGAEMITVGGALVPEDEAEMWSKDIGRDVTRVGGGNHPAHQRLDLIPLTLKEKLALDECLPHSEEGFLAGAIGSGLKIEPTELVKYWRHHRHFPIFFEAPI